MTQISKSQTIMAKCRLPNKGSADLPLVDISHAGCLVDLRSWPITPNQRISVKLPDLDYRPGEVIWVEDGKAGVLFDELLHEAVAIRLKEQTSLAQC